MVPAEAPSVAKYQRRSGRTLPIAVLMPLRTRG